MLSARRDLWVSMGSLMFTMFLAALDQTVVATALPTIAGELHGVDSLSWLVTAFALTSGISTPLYGKLSDMYGRRRLYLSAIVLFLAGSALCGLATSMGQLIAFRAFQGIGAGGLIVLTMTIMADIATPAQRARFQGLSGVVMGVASISGPLVGGLLTEHVSWRWIFYINLPLGAVALAVAFAVLKLPRRTSPHRIDWLGFALISGVLICLTLLASWGGVTYAWSSPVIVGLGIGAVVLLGLFVLVERRVAEPIVPLRLFADRTLSLGAAAIVLLATGMLGAATFLTTFLQLVTGVSVSNSGLLTIPMMAGMVLTSMISGQVVARAGRYKWFVVAGVLVTALAAFLFTTMSATTGAFTCGVYMLIFGAGLGMVMQNLVLGVQSTAPPRDRGAATSAITFARGIGGAVGVSILGAVFTSRLGSGVGSITPAALGHLSQAARHGLQLAFADAVTGVFAVLTPLLVLGAVLLAFLPDVRLAAPQPAPEQVGASA